MIYLIRIFYFFLIIFSFNANSIENNKILFKINKNTFTNVDYERRIHYIEILNNLEYSKLNIDDKNYILEDFISAQIFNEYNNQNNFLKKNFNDEIEVFFKEIIIQKNSNVFNEDEIIYLKNNIKLDITRKKIIEKFLEDKRDLLNKKTNKLDLVYNYNLNLIIINKELIDLNDLNKIKNRKDFINFKENNREKKINFYFKDENINDKSAITKNISDLLDNNIKIHIIEDSKFVSIYSIVKSLESYEGIFVKLVSLISDKNLENDKLNCNYLKDLKDKTNFKEYEYSQLNLEIKNNLKSIDDYILIKNNDNYNYIFLCELRFDENILSKIDLNKRINSLAKDIEKDFFNKYQYQYNLERLYE